MKEPTRRQFLITIGLAAAATIAAPVSRASSPRSEGGTPSTRRTLFWRGRRGDRTREAVRDGDMKYIWETDGRKTNEYLFDLKNDVSEKHDLLAERPEQVKRLKALLADWEQEVRPVR